MLFIGTRAMPIISTLSKYINMNFTLSYKGMYEPHCTSNCAIGIYPTPPI